MGDGSQCGMSFTDTHLHTYIYARQDIAYDFKSSTKTRQSQIAPGKIG